MPLHADTIVAISTAPGRAGIGVVRLSGPEARGLGEQMLRLRGPLVPGRARLAYLLDASPEADGVSASQGAQPAVLDEVVATFWAGPRSYTGEDVLEIAAHGAPVLLQAIVRGAMARGSRLAEPGEFTQRAFEAGRLDLAQAEAVHDLIAATTLHQARVAAAQLGGGLAREIAGPKAELVGLIAALEAGIDFAEDDLELLPDRAIGEALERVAVPLRRLESTFRYGQALAGGLSLVLAGAPNTGKSSLFNALLGRDRAIVTAVPGTTRDTLSESLNLLGLPVELTDTAGLRETAETVERMGIERSRTSLAEAAGVVVVVDAAGGVAAEDAALLRSVAGRPVLVVANKMDLMGDEGAAVEERVRRQLRASGAAATEVVATSALTGEGLPGLRSALYRVLAAEAPAQDTVVVTSLRQQGGIAEALAGLEAAGEAMRRRVPHEMLLLDLYGALRALDGLTGATTTDSILEQIFSTFCIGK